MNKLSEFKRTEVKVSIVIILQWANVTTFTLEVVARYGIALDDCLAFLSMIIEDRQWNRSKCWNTSVLKHGTCNNKTRDPHYQGFLFFS